MHSFQLMKELFNDDNELSDQFRFVSTNKDVLELFSVHFNEP